MSEFYGGFVCDYQDRLEGCDGREDCVGCPPYEFWAGRKPILDPCCGSRMFWFNKNNPHALYCDCRELEPTQLSNGATIEVKPDMIMDVTALPFANESFWHIVFDPPHALRAGKNGWMAKKYGCLPGRWENFMYDAFAELWRVLKTNGTLIFKWNDFNLPLSRVLETIPPEVARCKLYGHPSGKQAKTHWVAFVKLEEHDEMEQMI